MFYDRDSWNFKIISIRSVAGDVTLQLLSFIQFKAIILVWLTFVVLKFPGEKKKTVQ